MSDDLLIDYVLDQLGPDERAAVEAQLAERPADRARLARLQSALKPLEADRDGIDPPSGLAAAAIARAAEHAVVLNLLKPREVLDEPKATPKSRRVPADLDPVFPAFGWRSFDLAVAVGIGFLAFGLIFAGIGKLRHEKQVMACQNQLRQLHAALVGYAETHGGRYPEVGTEQVPTAGAFVVELNRAGQYPTTTASCPTVVPEPLDPDGTRDAGVIRVGYAYNLGYVGTKGQVIGVRRADAIGGASDAVAIAADLPTVSGVGLHGGGQNVLHANGTVRYTTATVLNGDDIYRNDAGLHRAGLHRNDTSLGRPSDFP
jgi:hypothetical protein